MVAEFEPRFGIVIRHPNYDLTLIVLGPAERNLAKAAVLLDEDGRGEKWPVGTVREVSTRGWIILEPGIEP